MHAKDAQSHMLTSLFYDAQMEVILGNALDPIAFRVHDRNNEFVIVIPGT